MQVAHNKAFDVPVRQHYDKAPIREAVIAINVHEKTPIDRIRELSPALKGPLAIANDIVTQTVQFLPHPGPATQEVVGRRFLTEDGRWAATFETSRLLFSALRPYSAWEDFRDQARANWAVYRDFCQPKTVGRIAVRYINEFHIPIESLEEQVGDYFEIHPAMPQGLKYRKVTNSFMQLVVPQEDIGCMLIINVARPQDDQSSVVRFLLDFDLFREGEWPVDDEQAIWDFLEVLHTRVHDAFENCITEKTRRLIL